MTTMSDGPSVFAPLYAESCGFRGDARFSFQPAAPEALPLPETLEERAAADPLAEARAAGYAQGLADARAEAAEAERHDAAAREGLALAFARLDRSLEEELRLRLRDTVAALCEAALAPLALDEDALLRRIDRAAAMLARADDDKVLRLHPDDLKLVHARLAAEWTVQPDPALERGALRVETGSGGVEDGPCQWRQAIAEALHQC